MRKLKENQEQFKTHSFRIDSKTWEIILKRKGRGKTWDLYFKELFDLLNKLKDN